ncbi:MAG TPA: HEAT repeat domain-containing protein [Myxococcales bacterium]|nr:HEAT repeat domain-containing protein [Myxococcales bacterium]
MPLLDMFSAEAKLRRLTKKITEKYGPPENRQKAIETLADMDTPEALAALLMRFTISSDPSITDAEEKQHVFELLVDAGEKAVGPLKDFMRKQDSVSWALRALVELLPLPDVATLVLDELARVGPEYTRDPEKKVQLITWLAEHRGETVHPRLGATLIPFLEDMSDDVKLAALRTLTQGKVESAREPILAALVAPEQSARVRQDLLASLADLGLGVQGYREKVEALVSEPYYVDKAGLVKRR